MVRNKTTICEQYATAAAAHFVAGVLGVELPQNGNFRLSRIAVLVADTPSLQSVLH